MINQKEGLVIPDQGTAVGGKGADGKFYFLQVASDGSITTSGSAGGATAAKQDTGNTSLAAIDTNTRIPTLSRFRDTALTNTAVAIKATAGNVHGWNFINLNTVPVYVKFYNIAAAGVTVGTSTVAITIAVPASGVHFVRSELVPQQTFSTAISVAVVTGLADNSTTAPATAIHGSVHYQ